MIFILNFYHNVIIYYPNIFFAFLLLLLSIGCMAFFAFIEQFIQQRKKNKNQKKEPIKKEAGIIFSPLLILLKGVNTVLDIIQFYLEKVGRKIGREIFIEEK